LTGTAYAELELVKRPHDGWAEAFNGSLPDSDVDFPCTLKHTLTNATSARWTITELLQLFGLATAQ